MSTMFGKFIKAHPPTRLETYELKFTKKKRISFDAVQEHQVHFLEQSNFGLYYKITDTASADGFSAKKPFDAVFMVDAVPFIVVWFYKPREHKIFYKINIVDFLVMKQNSKMKSFTEEDLYNISERLYIT